MLQSIARNSFQKGSSSLVPPFFRGKAFSGFSSDKQDSHKVFLDEESIKKKIQQLKKKPDMVTRDSKSNSKNPDLMPFYKIPVENKEVQSFRRSTGTEDLFAFKDRTLEQGDDLLQITNYGEEFIEVSGFPYPPSLVLLPKQVFNWEVESSQEIKLHHFSILSFIDPYPDYVLVGVPDSLKIPDSFKMEMRKRHRNIDILSMFEAVSQFNTVINNDVNVVAFINNI